MQVAMNPALQNDQQDQSSKKPNKGRQGHGDWQSAIGAGKYSTTLQLIWTRPANRVSSLKSSPLRQLDNWHFRSH
jgi:hypothetical protein